MLPARHRLRRSADFSVAVRGITSGSRLVVVHARRTDAPAGQPARVGFVVSKAVGNAVVRNRTKRRLRALVATRLTSAPDGVDLVIRANPAAASATTTQLERSLDTAWSAALQRLSQPRSRETPRSETPRTRATSAVPQS